jgi:radical SAM superfamily enzyme YgiQ (UPF0313 family)
MMTFPQDISRGARYLGIEPNSVFKTPGPHDVRFALCYPDIYEIGMSYFGLFLLYELLNNKHGVWCERCFAPWHDMEGYLRRSGTPLSSLESATPLSEFDIVGFSLTYELNVTNVLNMLQLGGIPLRAAERESGPIVLGGGPLMLNPRPFESFFDLIVVGEADDVLPNMVERMKGLKGERRSQVLSELSVLDGVYSPLDPKSTVKRLFVQDLNQAYHPIRPPIPIVAAVHSRLNVEISRGCGNGCRFCLAGYGYRPYRERSAETVFEIIDRSVRETGYEEVSLLSLSTGDHSCLSTIISYVRTHNNKLSLSLPSLKIGSITEEEIDLLGRGARGGFTFALEASSYDLRNRLNKDIEIDALIRTLPLLKKHGWRKVKLYFMVGFPWEKEGDFLVLKELIDPFVRQGIEVNLSVSPFTPKPHTPFQWLEMDDEGRLAEKIQLIKKAVPSRGVKVKARDIKTSQIEALIARGDKRLSGLFEELNKKGTRLEAWGECFNPQLYDEWLAREDGLREQLLGSRDRNETLPWDFIDGGVDKEFLLAELDRSEHSKITSSCYNDCSHCGLRCEGPRRGEKSRGVAGVVSIKSSGAKDEERNSFSFTLRYRKAGPSRHIGHLDTVDLLLRAFRAAGLELKMHGKFHPKPKVSLSNALPVGIESCNEYVKIETEGQEQLDSSTRKTINEHLPRGMEILEIKKGKAPVDNSESVYLLVGGHGFEQEAKVMKEVGTKVFYLWQGKNAKELWLSGRFSRIVKIYPGTRRSNGF